MKKVFWSLMTIVCMAIMMSSCKKQENQGVDSEMKYEREINFLTTEFGFQADDVKVVGDEIIVQDDIIFDGLKFWDHFTQPYENTSLDGAIDRVHKWVGSLVSPTSLPRTITLNVLPSASSYAPVIQLVANVWNAQNTKFKFVCQSSSQNTEQFGMVNIKVEDFGTASINVMAQASWPSGGNPGVRIRINSTGPYMTTSQKLKTLVHELGHCMGLCHTDTNDGIALTTLSTGCSGSQDPASVMRQGLISWSTFSNCDKEAISWLCGTIPPANSFVSIRSENFTNRHIMHTYSLGRLETISNYQGQLDATFKIVPGLAGGLNCISFESKNFPGYYLRHDGFRIKLAQNNGTTLFKNDATFKMKNGLFGTNENVSFESVNFPNRFIRHRNSELWVDVQEYTELYRKDASFKFVNPLAP